MSGRLIVIEGIDGSGKGTQAARLADRLKQAGYRTALLSFPRYQQTEFGRQIGHFLNGRFGSLNDVHPMLASLLFAGDRFESRDLILHSLAENEVVVCDRYVASNIAHQAAKRIGDERRELVEWIERLEFQLYRLPHADLTIWLDLPVSRAQELIALKSRRTYTEKAADLQEADAEYLQQVREVYAELAGCEPSWMPIHCLANNQLRGVDEIANEVFEVVTAVINTPSSGIGAPRTAIPSFSDLVTSRKTWLAEVLRPWCRSAGRKDLLLAEQEWTDIAGKVDPEKTLWAWGWRRFPGLVHEQLGIEETSEVVVTLRSGQEIRGYPDARQSQRGMLMLLSTNESGRFIETGPFSIDDVARVGRLATIDPDARGVP